MGCDVPDCKIVLHPNTASELLQTMDAKRWAEEFMHSFGERKEMIDEGLMLSWFANAIMVGWDHAHRKFEKKDS